MSLYAEFISNPWNFITKRLKITVYQKELEILIKNSLSDYNYRSLLLYQNSHLEKDKDELTYDKLSIVGYITVFIYIFDLDTYIIENPVDIRNSCISFFTVINKNYSQSESVLFDKTCYGLKGMYYTLARDFKVVYNSSDSTVYIEGNPSSQFHFFRGIKRFLGKCSIRIYSTGRYQKPCASLKDDFEPPQIERIINNIEYLYPEISLRLRLIEDKSYGLEHLSKLLNEDSKTAYKFLTVTPVYKTGITINDLGEVSEILDKMNIGIRTKSDYVNPEKNYEDRYFNYGYVGILEDTLIGLFFNSNSKKPMRNSYGYREAIFIYMNQYCYFIGKTNPSIFYSISENSILIQESNGESVISEYKTEIDKGEYYLVGNWKRITKLALLPSDKTLGKSTSLYYRDTNRNLNLVSF